MKGIVFTEFLNLVEDRFGLEILDNLLTKSNLESNGIFTSVGTYDHAEMVELVSNLSNIINIDVPKLLLIYGEHFFQVLHNSYPVFFQNIDSSLDFMESLESYIHPEVLKLYPDAELPRFISERPSNNHLELIYISSRKLAAFANGLMNATIKHYNEDVKVTIIPLQDDMSEVKFILIKNG
ncbi:MAG: hypothetical protein ACI8Q1_000403 [Parvicella sp.]|jgi:hypothetical protein